jgi:DNA-binding winged helix-turn-helix (wHTH) protein
MIFIGRDQNLVEMESKLMLFNQILISGPAGSGKTSFVKKYLQKKSVGQSEVIWLNFNLPKWPYHPEGQQLIFEDYFSDLYSRRLEKYKFIIFDQVQKLNAAQISFLSFFVEQLMGEQKFIFIASEVVQSFEQQAIILEEFSIEEGKQFFKIYFPEIDFSDYVNVLSERTFFPQEILFLPRAQKSIENLHILDVSAAATEALQMVSLIDKAFTLNELPARDVVTELSHKYLIKITESNDQSVITSTQQMKNYFTQKLSKNEKEKIYLKHLQNVQERKTVDALHFKYFILLEQREAVLNYLAELSMQDLNQIPVKELQVLSDYLISIVDRIELSSVIKQKLIQILLLSAQRDKSIYFAKIWLQQWSYLDEISEADQAFIYELIHLLNRSDLYKVAEQPLNFYLNRVGEKYKSLLRLETVLFILKDDPKSAIQSLERILSEYTENNKQLGAEEKRTLAHLYFQLGRAESISRNYEKSRSCYDFSEKYYKDCGLHYNASIASLNYAWTFFSERNFSFLFESLKKMFEKYNAYGFLLTRFGYEILMANACLLNLENDKLILHLQNARKLLKHDLPVKPKSDFYQLMCVVHNFNFQFELAEQNYLQLVDLLPSAELEETSALIGRPASIEFLIDQRKEWQSDVDLILIQLLLLNAIDFNTLTKEELNYLRKSKMGNALLHILNRDSQITSENISEVLKSFGHQKIFYSADEVGAAEQFSLWTGQILIEKYFLKKQKQSVVKSYQQYQQEQREKTSFDLSIDDINREVHFKGKLVVELQGKNTLYKMLKSLVTQAPAAVSKEALALSVWGESYDPTVHDGRIYTSVQRLRDFFSAKNIQQSDEGYRLNPKLSCSIQLPALTTRPLSKASATQVLQVFRSAENSGKLWLTRKDLIAATQISESSVKRILLELIKENLISKSGDGANTKYKIK